MIDRRILLKTGGAAGAAFFVAMALTPPPARAADAEAATDFVAGMIDEAIRILKLPLSEKEQRKARFEALLVDNFDMPVITRLVVGRYWRRATEEQKSAFAQVFQEHIVNVYTSQLGVYKNETVEIKKAVARDDQDVIVFTEVIRGAGDPPLRLDWLIREQDGGFKVIDVAAEGVSMMTTKRSEFTAVIAREGVDGLISRLEQLNSAG